MMDNPELDPLTPEEMDELKQESDILNYIMGFHATWKQFRDQEYSVKFDRWERMSRGEFAEGDRERQSERSRLVTPLTMQACRTVSDEINETVLQSGELGSLVGGGSDPRFGAARDEFRHRLKADGWVQGLSDAVNIGCIYGSAFVELEQEDGMDYVVSEQEGPMGVMVGVQEEPRERVCLKAHTPRNVLVDWSQSNIHKSQGIIIEEYLAPHIVTAKMVSGQYRSVPVNKMAVPFESSPTSILTNQPDGVRVIRWAGKVPRCFLEDKEKRMGYAERSEEDKMKSGFVEAFIHLVGDRVALCSENPTMRKRRGIEHYQFERVPGRLLGRGIPEAGEMMQRATDSSVRAHLDSLAITSTPVTATDVTRFPKGFNFALYTGRNIGVNGPVGDAIKRLDLGQTDPALLATSQTFERLFMMAVGAMDSAMLPDMMKSGGDPTAMAIFMATLVRRNRQRVINFQFDVLIPLMEETYIRYVQFEPEKFPALPPKFEAVSSVGIIERQLESERYKGIMQTLGPSSPLVPILMSEVVGMSNTRNREKLLATLEQAQKIAMEQANDQSKLQAAQLAQLQTQLNAELTKANISETYERAHKLQIESALAPRLAQAEMIGNMSKNIRDNSAPDEFARRAQIAEMLFKEKDLELKEKDIDSNERIARMQIASKPYVPGEEDDPAAAAMRALTESNNRLHETMNTPDEMIYDTEGNITGRRKATKKEAE